MSLSAAVCEAIGAARGRPFVVRRLRPVAGGCINRAFVAGDGGETWFIKVNEAMGGEFFEAEADGLRALADSGVVRVPAVVAAGARGGLGYIVLEHLEMTGRGSPAAMGEALAALHRDLGPSHGWRRDNYIGATPQENAPDEDWPRFYARRRLLPQLERARRTGCGSGLYEDGLRLAERLGGLFAGYAPAPSLLHGDLWGGNTAYLDEATPVLFDPAVHRGDRETDLAMTELFGGFAPGFYAAYRAAWPLDAGYAARKPLYQLYHVLNHYNLFGGAYLGQARSLVAGLLRELG